MKVVSIVAMVATLLTYETAFSQSYLLHPEQRVRLGSGFFPDDIGEDRSLISCISFQEDDGGEEPEQVELEFEVIETSRQLYDRLGVSMSATAQYGFSTADINSELERIETLDENSLVYHYGVEVIFPPNSIAAESNNVQALSFNETGETALNSAGRRFLIGRKRPKHFFDVCGTELVTSVTRGARASLIYVFDAKNQYYRNELQSHLEANYGSNGGNIDLARIRSEVSNHIDLQVQAFITGAGDEALEVIDISNLELGDVNGAIEILNNAIQSVEKTTSPIIRFNTSKYNILPQFNRTLPGAYENYTTNRDILEDIFVEYGRTRATLTNIHSLLSVARSPAFGADGAARLETTLAEWEQRHTDLWEAGRLCALEGNCTRPSTKHFYPTDYIESGGRIEAFTINTYCEPRRGNHDRVGIWWIDADVSLIHPSSIRNIRIAVETPSILNTDYEFPEFTTLTPNSTHRVERINYNYDTGLLVSGDENWDWSAICIDLNSRAKDLANAWLKNNNIEMTITYFDGGDENHTIDGNINPINQSPPTF